MLDGKTVIKSIATKYGKVSLIQADNDTFVIRTAEYWQFGESIDFSSEFKDYNMANCLFNIKATEIGVIE